MLSVGVLQSGESPDAQKQYGLQLPKNEELHHGEGQ